MSIDIILSDLTSVPVPSDKALRRKAVAAQLESATCVEGFTPRAVLARGIELLTQERQQLRGRKAAGEDVKSSMEINGGRLELLIDAHDIASDSGVFSRGRALAASQALYRAEAAAAASAMQSARLSAGLAVIGEELSGIREILAKIADKP